MGIRIIATSAVAIQCLMLYSESAVAQASLAAENTISEVPIEITRPNGKSTENFTLIRDALNKEQWYYVPNAPRLTIVQGDNGGEPEFSLLRYAVRDPNNNLQFSGGGLINFSVSLAAPSSAIGEMEKAIVKHLEATGGVNPTAIRVAALPFRSATANIYTPKGSQLGDEPLGVGPSAIFATQKMVFTIPASQIGADVYDSLIGTNAGIPIAIRFKFNGLTPPAGFTVDVDWDQAFNHYSRNDEFRAAASYYGLFGYSLVGGSAAYSTTEIRESLVNNKVIKVNIVEGEDFSIEKIDPYLQPILKRINDEILRDMQPPAQITPAAAPSPPSAGGWFANATFSSAVKDVSIVKKGTERVDFRYSKHVERETVASGFVGLSGFSDAIKKKSIVAVDNSLWLNSYLPLPPVPTAVDKVNLNIGLVLDGKIYDSQNVSFNRSSGWADLAGKSIDRVSFSLLKIKNDKSDEGVRSAKYHIDYVVQANEDTISAKVELPVVENDSISIAPKKLIDVVHLDPGGLPWKSLQRGDLSRATIYLQTADQEYRHTFRTGMVGDKNVEPPPVYWVFKKAPSEKAPPIKGSVEFRIGNDTKTWSFTDLAQVAAGLEIFLDEHIQAAQ